MKGDTDVIKIKKPKDVIAWRGFVTLAFAVIGVGQYAVPKAAITREEFQVMSDNVASMRQQVAVFTATAQRDREEDSRRLTDHELRLRGLERNQGRP
jgi:hypothetical protein